MSIKVVSVGGVTYKLTPTQRQILSQSTWTVEDMYKVCRGWFVKTSKSLIDRNLFVATKKGIRRTALGSKVNSNL